MYIFDNSTDNMNKHNIKTVKYFGDKHKQTIETSKNNTTIYLIFIHVLCDYIKCMLHVHTNIDHFEHIVLHITNVTHE